MWGSLSRLTMTSWGRYEYRNRGKGKGGLITVGEGTSFHVHINGWGAYEAPKASMGC